MGKVRGDRYEGLGINTHKIITLVCSNLMH